MPLDQGRGMISVCAIGDAGIDYYADYNLCKPGGCSLNFACHYRIVSPHSNVMLLSAVGTSSNNRPSFDCIERYEIECEIQYLEGLTPLQPIRLHVNGEKIFFNYEIGVLKDFVLNKSQVTCLQNSNLLMTVLFRGNERLVSQVIKARTSQKIAIDFMNMSDYKKSIEVVLSYLERSDISFFGLDKNDVELIAALKSFSRKSNHLVVITLGESGSLALQNGKEVSAFVENPVKMVDSTGAGDSFAAAFLASHMNGEVLSKALEFANTHAAKTVQHLGAIPY
jgi:fructoselysine 6-kinase